MELSRERAREEWPLVLGLVTYVAWYVYLYLLGDAEWQPFGAALLAALGVWLVAEGFRSWYGSDENRDEDSN